MKSLRCLGFAFWLAFALVVGQQAAALHDLGHATSQLDQKGGKAPSTCDKCFLCAQLSGAMGASIPVLPIGTAHDALPAFHPGTPAPAVTALAFRSRAPPTLL